MDERAHLELAFSEAYDDSLRETLQLLIPEAFDPAIDPFVWAIKVVNSFYKIPGLGSAVEISPVPFVASPSWLRFSFSPVSSVRPVIIVFDPSRIDGFIDDRMPGPFGISTPSNVAACAILHELGHRRVASQKDVSQSDIRVDDMGWFPMANHWDELRAHFYAGALCLIFGTRITADLRNKNPSDPDFYIPARKPL